MVRGDFVTKRIQLSGEWKVTDLAAMVLLLEAIEATNPESYNLNTQDV